MLPIPQRSLQLRLTQDVSILIEEDPDREITDLLRRTKAKSEHVVKIDRQNPQNGLNIRPAMIAVGVTLCASLAIATANAVLNWDKHHLTHNLMQIGTATIVGIHAIQTTWTYRRQQRELTERTAEETRQKQIRLTLKQVDFLDVYHKTITNILKAQQLNELQDIFFTFGSYSLSVPPKAEPEDLKGKMEHLQGIFRNEQIAFGERLEQIHRYAQEEIRPLLEGQIPKLRSQLIALNFLSADEEEKEEEIPLVTDLQPRYDVANSLQTQE